ncbi:MAG TPA: hypothetical protein VG013_11600 [Gemmataceae bacterium]|jgi:hypothetical protein|nr:hypothetical protein [Gemmataceae bacterium]
MNGIIRKSVLAACVTAGLFACAAGAGAGWWWSDPCYPERYQALSRQEVNAAFAPQMSNGHILDQTVWNTHFEPNTDQLTRAGMEHLAYLARRRPCPDPVVYLQVAEDKEIAYDPAAPDKFVSARNNLNALRIAAVQKYLSAATAGRDLRFNVVLHDPPEVGISAVPQGVALQQMNLSTQGVLKIYGGAGAGAAR